jgi:hypothetical protein
MDKKVTVDVFGVINLVIAGIYVLGVILVIITVVYGVFLSGDTELEIEEGIMGGILVLTPLLIGVAVYLTAGIGLMKRRMWGYYVHIGGAILAFFSIILIAYTIIALIFAFRPEFKDEFYFKT